MEGIFQGVYNFLSNNIYLLTIILCLTVIGTLLEKSEKIKTPIATLIKKHKEKQAKITQQEKEEKEFKEMIVKRFNELEDRILENEADRLRDVLFDCGNKCRRGLRLDGESYRHIQQVYKKYSEVLKQNGEGHDEYVFITDYYNNQNLNKKTNI